MAGCIWYTPSSARKSTRWPSSDPRTLGGRSKLTAMPRRRTASWRRSRLTERLEETRVHRNAAFPFHTIGPVQKAEGVRITLYGNVIHNHRKLASRVRMDRNERYRPLVGCRRPFSPPTERMHQLRKG